MKKQYSYILMILFFVFFTHKTFAQPYYDFTHASSPGNYSVGGINVVFNYNLNGGQVYIDYSCPNVLGYNFTNGGYFTFGFNVPVAGVRIRGIRQTFSSNTNIAIKINGTSYALNSSNISSFNACGYNTQGALSNGALVGGNGLITITQPEIKSLEIQNNGGDYWIFVVEILPLVTTTNTPCTGSTLNLTSDFGGVTSGVTYNWTGPNGFTSSLKNPSISNSSAANSGLYKVTASNGTVTASQTQNAYVNPIPTVNNVNNQTLCNGASVSAINFTSPANAGVICGNVNEGATLNLSAPPGAVFTNVQFASYGNPTGSCGTFVLGSCNSPNSLSVISTAALGKNSFSLAATNENFAEPCFGTPKNLKVQLNYNTPVTYTWTNSNTSIGLASSGTGNIPSFVATNSTTSPIMATITVTPKYTNGGTCSGTSKTFTITVNPSPAITNQPVSKTICNGNSTFFSASATNATGYQWQVNTGSGFVNINDTSTYSGSTTNTLTINGATSQLNGIKYQLLALGNCGSKASNIVTLTVSAINGSWIANNTSCNGESNGSINLTPLGGTPPYTFAWNDGIETEDRSGLAAGTYSVTINDSNGCTGIVSATILQPDAVDPPTGDAVQSFNSGDDLSVLIANGQNIKWYATAENATNLVDELPLSTPIINNTTYYATQTQGSCASAVPLAIKAYNPLLSVNDNIKSDVKITLYPNPVKDVLHFNAEAEIDKIAVFDVNGKKLLEKTLNGDHKINVQSLLKGVYLIQVFTENEIKTLKFFKD
ncbi:T9SS type A sorting domain-containing protein [Flavobacterium fluviatile]|uniref:T9SS type A sorting domain-containing protein n=1 Tax=Flavobacterium fluviatile TaxID=1862387 RepID=UPI0013D0B229|nr:T9SS type A sorting domain-containing protein [Flavobacterium fluviatile]